MKKSIYLTIIWIITIFCIMGGTCYHIMGWGESFFNHFNLSDSKKLSGQETLDTFDSISFDIDLSEVYIVSGSEYQLSYSCTNNQLVKYKVVDGTLTVTESSNNSHYPRRNGNDNCSITITVPRDAALSSVTGECRLGDVELSGLTAEAIDISCNLGEASITDVTASSIDCSCDLGNCEIDNCSFDNLTVHNSLGNVEVQSRELLSNYTLDLSVSMGEIEINDTSYFSRFQQDGDKDKCIKITCDMGSIELEDN